MNKPTSIILIIISSLSLVASSASLALMWKGSKKITAEVQQVKTKTNDQLRKFKDALNDLEI